MADEVRETPLELVAQYYAQRYRSHGDGAQGMDWKDEASQRLRFEVLARHLDLSDSPSLLDVGCGNGELLAYLRERGFAGEYRGIDVCAEMVEACRRRFGEGSALLADCADLPRLGIHADYVVASGTFNVSLGVPPEVWREHLSRAVRAMFDVCRVATVFNVMSSRVEHRRDHLFYFEAEAVARLADSCGTRRFIVDHDYPLFEMTVALLR